MFVQTVIVSLIVAACALSAIWNLMPAAARRVFALRALRLPWPAAVAARWERAATETSGCGGCKHAPVKGDAPSIHIVRKAASTKHG